MDEKEIIRFSDKLAEPIAKLYKVGGLGLVFIFLGFLFMVFSFVFPNGKFATPLFTVGSILLLCSFIIYLLVQAKVFDKAKRTLNENKVIIDDVQDISIELTRLTYNTQAYCFKNLEKVQTAVNAFLPLAKPFIGERGRNAISKIENLSNEIVEYTKASEQLIADLKNSLENGDLSAMKKYKEKVTRLNIEFKSALKQ